MQNQLKIVCVQADIVWENAEANIGKYNLLIDTIPYEVDLIILPEMLATGFSMNPSSCAETMNGISVEWMKRIALEKQVAIMGTLAIKEGDNFFNRLVFVHPDGTIESNDKRHLFSYGGEGKVYSAGKKRIIINYKGWKICPLICYDLRFPVWSRNNNNYDLLVYVANWPKPRISAWDTLLKTRAIENMCYTIGVNRVGVDENKLEYIGHTQAIDSLGNIIANSVAEREMIIETVLDKTELDRIWKKFQFLNDRDSFEIL